MPHKTRALVIKQRTMAVNALRGHLSEFSLIAARGIHRIKDLLALVGEGRTPSRGRPRGDGDVGRRNPGARRKDRRTGGEDRPESLEPPMIRHLDEIPALGPLIASAMVAFDPDPRACVRGAVSARSD